MARELGKLHATDSEILIQETSILTDLRKNGIAVTASERIPRQELLAIQSIRQAAIMNMTKCAALVDQNALAYKRRITGMQKNEDIVA